jgi:hypothetical protein
MVLMKRKYATLHPTRDIDIELAVGLCRDDLGTGQGVL